MEVDGQAVREVKRLPAIETGEVAIRAGPNHLWAFLFSLRAFTISDAIG